MSQETKPSDVAACLGDLKLSTAVPYDDSCASSCSEFFQRVGTPTSSIGSSIEIVPHFLDKVWLLDT